MYDFDLYVIGAGSGGVRTARVAAGLGARVAVAEGQYLGGTCVNVGCIPKKLYSMAAHYRYDFEDSAGFGWKVEGARFDWATLRDNKKSEIRRLNGIYRGVLEKAGAQLHDGRATIVDPHTVEVAGKRYSAGHILVATGGWPHVPDLPGREHVMTSNEIFDLEQFPGRLLIVGGGYIAVEFAGIFAGLGAEVTLSYRGELPMRGFDREVREFFCQEARKHFQVLLESNVREIVKNDDGSLRVAFAEGDDLEVDCVLYATGRKPNTADLGLEHTRVEVDGKGTIHVNDGYQTAEPSIYALGDVIGRIELTPVALAEGIVLAHRLFGNDAREMDYDNIATAVFSHPNIGTVGLSEEDARNRHPNLDIYKSDFRHLKHTISGRDARTFIKVIVNRDDDRVLGIHMVGEEAGEIVQGFAAAMKCGMTKAQMDSTVGIHPTAAEELVTLREPSS